MAKKKKIPEKLRLYYKGAATTATRVADSQEMVLIRDAFQQCLPNRSKCHFTYRSTTLKIVVGLKNSLRCLKQKRTKAIIYDDTASVHLTKYLNIFGAQQGIPVIQAHRLIDLAPELRLKTILIVSLIAAEPNDITLSTDLAESQPFRELCDLVFTHHPSGHHQNKLDFKLPELEQVPPSGNSKTKKEARKLSPKKRKNVDSPSRKFHGKTKQTHVFD